FVRWRRAKADRSARRRYRKRDMRRQAASPVDLVPKTPINNAGSRAGRGFRYQDAVGALLAAQGWVGASPYGAVTPEAHDDFDLAGAVETAFAQVKSRRDEAGLFSTADVAGFVSELWDRHD